MGGEEEERRGEEERRRGGEEERRRGEGKNFVFLFCCFVCFVFGY